MERTFYTLIVEHYFKLALRVSSCHDKVGEEWRVKALGWIDSLAQEDRELLWNAFHERKPVERYRRLRQLEKRFARYAGLI